MSWHENLQPGEIPPEYLWEDAEGLEQWWATIEDKRSGGEEPSKDRIKISDDGDDAGDADQAPGMAENDYARFFKRN